MKISYFLIIIILLACKKTYYDKPVFQYATRVWKLEKIEGKKATILSANIPYEQLLHITTSNAQYVLNLYKDKNLEKKISANIIRNEVNKKGFLAFELPLNDNTFIKMEFTPDEKAPEGVLKLMTSGFIENSSKIDTVRYYYSYLRADKNW